MHAVYKTDQIGKDALERGKFVYMYRNRIPIPSLTMIDDVLTISECGLQSVKNNAFVNSKIEMKRLTFNSEKCKKIHIGKEDKYCPTLYAHDKQMQNSSHEKYLFVPKVNKLSKVNILH